MGSLLLREESTEKGPTRGYLPDKMEDLKEESDENAQPKALVSPRADLRISVSSSFHFRGQIAPDLLSAGSKQRICSSFLPDLLAEVPLLIQPDLLEESQEFQIQVKLLGKTRMHWVRAIDLVQDLLQKLECRLGIPSSFLRLLCKGKQLMNPLPLSFYSIHKDASIGAYFHLRGGSFGQTSSAPSFSYKDASSKDATQP